MNLHQDFTDMIVKALPDDVREMLESVGPWACVAGGFCRDIITAKTPKDVDVFFTDEAALKEALAKFTSERYIKTETANAVTFKPFLPGDLTPCVQFITRVFEPWHSTLIESFDFSICQAAVYCDGGKRWQGLCTPAFWEDITSSTLHYTAPNRNEDPGASVLRMLRFVERGYRIGEEDVAKVVGRFYAQLDSTPEPCSIPITESEATARVQKAFSHIGYAGRQTQEDTCLS